MLLIKHIKTLLSGLSVIAALWTAPALAAGTLPIAMAQQVDINGAPLAGCQVQFFVAGTPASPQNSYQDFSLTQANPQILSCDQAGRVPMFWLADGLVHVRMTDAAGGPVIDTTMQVLGPSSGGGGGGGTVDPTTILATGDLKIKYGTGPLPGFVRANGLTIGNATSGATERANADAQALFVYFYGVDPNLVVSGGRTGNALNDFNASKTITTPDWAGRAIAALDDMGAGARGRLTATYFGTSATVLGAAGGNQSVALSLAQLPSGITSNNAAQAITVTGPTGHNIYGDGTIVSDPDTGGPGNHPKGGGLANNWTFQGNNSISVTSNNTGGAAHPTVPPAMLATIYIKL